MFELKKGACRYCLLIGNYAIKFPKFTNLEVVLLGLLSNVSERKLWQYSPNNHKQLYCPVLWELWGLVLVMPRVKMLKERNTMQLLSAQHQFINTGITNFQEAKFVNLGHLGDRLVSVDYSSYHLTDVRQLRSTATEDVVL